MKVQCGQCPAKYAVSDERVVDKKVRIHCKRCGASIVVDGKVNPPLVTSTPARQSTRPTAASPDRLPPVVERSPDSRPSPRPVAHTILGGLEAPIAERLQRPRSSPPPRFERGPFAAATEPAREETIRMGMPATHRGFTDPPPGAPDERWRVALTKQDLRWMTTDEIVEAYHAGAVKLETFVFRAGMPTWVTLLEVPEIAEALSESGETITSNSSLPPPRSPSSMPPPRKPPLRAAAAPKEPPPEAPADELDNGETVPFALVTERANGAAPEALEPIALDELRISAVPDPPELDSEPPPAAAPPAGVAAAPQAASPAQLAADLHTTSEGHSPSQIPFAAAQQASGSSRWLWVVLALFIVGAAVAVLGPRFGVRLF
jgi:hypothetical protein